MSKSPVSILFNTDGVELNVGDNTALVPSTTALLVAGSDGTNTYFLKTDNDGRLITTVSGLEFTGTVQAGTEYTEGATDATITGTAILMEGGSNTLLPVQGTIADGLLVNLGNNNDVVVTNAGTFAVQAAQQGAWNITNISGTVSLPTGASTAALQTTGNTSLATLAGTVSGSEVQVDVLTLPSITGTVAISNTSIPVTQSGVWAVTVSDGSGPLTVDGTVSAAQSGAWNITDISGTVSLPTGAATAALQTTGNTSLATLAGAVSGTEMQVDVLTMPSVTVTATNLDIRDLTNADVVTAELSAVDNAVLDAIAASLNTLDNTVAGNELQVDVLTMPTTTVQATDLDIRDLSAATDTITVHGDVGVFDQLDLTNSNPATVAIVDANGDQITSFGGGVQYTENDVDASITGTAVLMESGVNTLVPLQGTPQDGLLVNLGSNNDVLASQAGTWNVTNISGTVSLPTGASTAALQTTGNTSLATIAGAVSGTEMQVDVVTLPALTVVDIEDGMGFSVMDPSNNAVKVNVVTGSVTTNAGTGVFTTEFNLGTTARITSASVSAASSGANTLVSGTGGQTIRVFKIFLVCAAAVNIKFQSGSTDLTGLMNMTANGSFVLDYDSEPWFITADGENFVLNLSGAVQVSGRIYYTKS